MMKETIEKFLEFLPELTQHESDLLAVAASWDGETKAAFLMAKKIFESKEEDERRM